MPRASSQAAPRTKSSASASPSVQSDARGRVTCSDDEAIRCNDEVISCDEEVIGCDEEVLASNYEVIRCSDEVIRCDQEVLAPAPRRARHREAGATHPTHRHARWLTLAQAGGGQWLDATASTGWHIWHIWRPKRGGRPSSRAISLAAPKTDRPIVMPRARAGSLQTADTWPPSGAAATRHAHE
mmetsp:Transcript_29116/g.85134  ORF Transcript_29116/g.85134 Transcript_29116/m.85134 type:complete len:184 (+) Transcript_29116:418-969(+)|eukprot:895391-Prymnesium_polylepis.1